MRMRMDPAFAACYSRHYQAVPAGQVLIFSAAATQRQEITLAHASMKRRQVFPPTPS